MRRTLAMVAGIVSPAPAFAVGIVLGGGVAATSGAYQLGQMSPYATDAGVTTEDFASPAGCAASKVSVTGSVTVGSKSLVNRRLTPSIDNSCYFAVGTSALVASATMTFSVPAGKRIDYLGFYWGSIDPYDYLSFSNGAGNRIPLGALGNEIDGAALAAMSGGPEIHTSSYVAFTFSIGEVVRSITLRQTNFAFEIDNLSYRLVDVFPNAFTRADRVTEPTAVWFSIVPLVILSVRRARSGRAAA